jgi:hypothetical protein
MGNPLYETQSIGNAKIDLAMLLSVKIAVEQLSKASSVRPVCGALLSPVQPTKQLL